MNLPRIMLACALALALTPVLAQEKPNQELTAAEWRARIQADKKSIVERGMKLTPDGDEILAAVRAFSASSPCRSANRARS
jgi:hypothetical protein